ncbi:hypothetical protein WS83_21635 [Burkholderia sp. MSMB2042]|nr:hypothetical protein WS78_27870 [Burkholderia savannae]KVG46153.1 hypothetical protein WS77_30820 [Burkholderia sp. MSMB0265]KVG89701.1 hypothetical protein WS81_21975 [Burkholderia sp. MSMB2040]KVG91678.1 hypothetical protein WS82_13755 [Burkholderia sp. MSMB2041]KVH00934.1 hypothetical protein WS83_21635 [Burkholderia sp. MSMB2042]
MFELPGVRDDARAVRLPVFFVARSGARRAPGAGCACATHMRVDPMRVRPREPFSFERLSPSINSKHGARVIALNSNSFTRRFKRAATKRSAGSARALAGRAVLI